MTLTRSRLLLAIPALAAAVSLATPAFAHPGHGLGGGFTAGFAHPLTGWDHLAATLLIGAWAGILSRTPGSRSAPAIMLPAFLTAMFAGFASGALFHANVIEWTVIGSAIAAAAAVIVRWRAPLPIAATLVALFGFAHGQAHGVDVPGVAPVTPFVLGFLLESAGLLAVGLAAVRPMHRMPQAPRRPLPQAGGETSWPITMP